MPVKRCKLAWRFQRSDKNHIIDGPFCTATCQAFPDYPLAVLHADGDVVDREIIMCGGYEKASDSLRAECYKYDQGTNSWTLLAMLDSGLNRCVSSTLSLSSFAAASCV